MEGSDAVLVTTGHTNFKDIDPKMMLEKARGNSILDTRRVLDRDSWTKAGWDFRYLGDGK